MIREPDQLLGRTVGPYIIDRLIGQGGFAWVFQAHHTGSGGAAALKILRPRYAGDEQFATRFRNEAKVAVELQHPNIVRVQEVGETPDVTYFAMDHYPETLADRLQNGPLPEADLVRVAVDVTRGLAFAHQAGIVHRDIKVDNIMFSRDGTAVIADFGIARAVSGYVTATGVNMTIGTAAYVSPEQAQGRALDGRSDLYALGVTLYKAATGEVPFRSTDWFELARMHVEVPPATPRDKNPALSRRFERIILKCLAKHPDDRYPSATELLTELEAIQEETRRTETFGVGASTLIRAMKAPPKPSRPGWLLGLAAVLVVVLAALFVIYFGRR